MIILGSNIRNAHLPQDVENRRDTTKQVTEKHVTRMFLFRVAVVGLFLVGLAICHEHRSGSAKLSDHEVNFGIGHRNDTAQGNSRVSEVPRPRHTERSILFLPDIVAIPPRESAVRTLKPFYPDDFFHMIAEGNNSKSRHDTTASNSRQNNHHRAPADTTGATATTWHSSTLKTMVPTEESRPTGRPKATTTTPPAPHTQPSSDHSTLPKSTTRPTLVTDTATPERSPDETRVPTSSLRTTSATDIRTAGPSSDNTQVPTSSLRTTSATDIRTRPSSGNTPVPTSTIQTTPTTDITTTGLPSKDTTAPASASTQDVSGSIRDGTSDADFGSTTDTSGPLSSDTPTHGAVTMGTITGDHQSVTKLRVPFSASDLGAGLPGNSPPDTSPTDLPGTSPRISTEKSVTLHGKSHTLSTPRIREGTKERTIDTLLMAPAALITGEEIRRLRGHQGGSLARAEGKHTAQLEHILEQMMAELVQHVRDYIQDYSHKQKLSFLDEFIQKYKAQILHP